MDSLQNKTIVIGVTGGIAAYKAVDVVSRLKKLGANVRVVMTRAACKFVAPLTFQSMSQNMVATDMFDTSQKWEIEHISLADAADVYAVIPATANVIGKIAGGIADDILTTSVMATKAPVLIAPAMNTNMYTNPIVLGNIEKMQGLGYSFIEPGEGRLACGITGKGRLANTEDIVERIVELALYSNKDLAGKTVLVTAGATEEDIDAVRFITNHSSGKMGYSIAKAAKRRGANVLLISGRTSLPDLEGVETVKVRSALQMRDAVFEHAERADIIIKSAAVGDFRVEQASMQKLKKADGFDLKFTLNPDILKELGERYGGKKIIVGFCMETENLIENAKKKILSKHINMIVANDLNTEGAGFGVDTNVAAIIDDSGKVEQLDILPKEELAHKILDRILKLS